MSLRFRLFVLLGGLLALLVGAELWLVRTLTRDLSLELERVATSVGRDVIRFMGHLGHPDERVLLRRRQDAGPGAEASWLQRPAPGTPLPTPGPGQRAAFSYVIATDGREAGDKPGGEVSAAGTLTLPREPSEAVDAAKALPPPAGVKVFRESRTETVAGPDGKPVTRQVLSELRISATGGAGGVPRVIVLEAPGLPHPSVIDIPRKGMEEAVGRFRDRLLFGSLGILGAGLLGAAVVAVRITAPLRQLAAAARQVGEGAFGAQVPGGGAGEVGEAIGAFNRMSSRLEHLEREAIALKEREHLSELGEVGRGLAHALRNPLHAVGLTLDELAALSRDEARERADELSDSARRQMRHVDDSIRSFLALASGGAGNEESVDVRRLVEEVALTALHDARGRVRLSVTPAASSTPDAAGSDPGSSVELLSGFAEAKHPGARAGDGPRLRAVPAELKAALQALVVNAIEASPEGSRVDVTVRPLEDGGARVEVIDEGPGLPAEVRGKLFTPHVTTKPAGSGMGLFLAHRLSTTRYAGDLTLTDREDAPGTVAALTLRDRTGRPDGNGRSNA